MNNIKILYHVIGGQHNYLYYATFRNNRVFIMKRNSREHFLAEVSPEESRNEDSIRNKVLDIVEKEINEYIKTFSCFTSCFLTRKDFHIIRIY